jgi:VanZ family protein
MKRLTILFAAFIVLVIVLADTGHLGFLAIVYEIPRADKVAHFLLYGILALLLDLTLMRSYPGQSRRRIALVSGIILALLIGLEEFSQRLFANRTFSLLDLMASYLGVFFFSWLAVKTGKQ